MKSPNKHIDNKIKQKITEHEFEFSDHAWNKMEDILDPPSTSRKPYFFIFLSFLTMMVFLILYYMLGVSSPDFPEPQLSEHTYNNATENTETDDTTTENIENEIDLTQIDSLKIKTKMIQPMTKLVEPELKMVKIPVLTTPITPINTYFKLESWPMPNWLTDSMYVPRLPATDHDPALIQELKSTLAEHESHFATEKLYVQFDRTWFKPGETIWFNTFLRDANTLKPSTKSDIVHIEFTAPNGKVLKKHKIIVGDGTGSGTFKIPTTAVGGEYTVKAFTNWQRNQNLFFKKNIQVNKTVLPKLKMTLDMDREAYGPGDEVSASLTLKDVSDIALSKKKMAYSVQVGGKSIMTKKAKTDINGKVKLKFDLPDDLSTTDGLVNVVIEHLGQMESIARTIPIVLNKIDLQFLPEGGYLLSDKNNGLGFKAINEFGKPADITGVIYDENGKEVSEFTTYHQGMGAIDFQPQSGHSYYAKIVQPEGINEEFPIPDIQDRGYGVKVVKNTGDSLWVDIQTTENEPLTLIVQSRGVIHDFVVTKPEAGVHQHVFGLEKMPIGIAQLTLFDGNEMPRAERMVFLNPDKKLNIDIQPDKATYAPREEVKLNIKVADERGIPLAGKFSLSVADDNLLTFADDKQGNILANILLESELKGEIEEPNFYFEPKDEHPDKDQLVALDHLMLTQGWRRFDWGKARGVELAEMKFENEEAKIAGVVYNRRNNPIKDVEVSILGTTLKTKTDEDGVFSFDNFGIKKSSHSVALIYKGREYLRSFSSYNEPVNFILKTKNAEDVFSKPSRDGKTSLSGRVIDYTGETLIGANVLITQNGALVKGTNTDIDGKFSTSVEPGVYDVSIEYIGYLTSKVEDVNVQLKHQNVVDVTMNDDGVVLDEVVVLDYSVPLIERDNTTSGTIVTSEEIRSLPTKNIKTLASTTAGLSSFDEGANVVVRGSRSDATEYYVDGVRITGSLAPVNNLDDELLTGTAANRSGFEREEEVSTEFEFLHDMNPDRVKEERAKKKRKKETSAIARQKRYEASLAKSYIYHQPTDFYSPKYTALDKQRKSTTRTDFRSTLYWNPSVETGMDGTTTVSFFTSDELTSFKAVLEGFGQDGSIGSGEKVFANKIPFSVAAKFPTRLLMGDEVEIPVIFNNTTDQTKSGKLDMKLPEGLVFAKDFSTDIKVKANSGMTIFVPVKATRPHPKGKVEVGFESPDFQDRLTGNIEILAKGFPVSKGFTSKELSHEFTLDIREPVANSVSLKLNAQTSLDKEIIADLKRMVRQPSGCFEQVSSSNYPNLLVMDYLQTIGELDHQTKLKLKGFLKKGYKKLTGYETETGGFDWYGKPPGHEALTAYGILQFTDMSAVFDVDQDMIERNAEWLLSRRDGKGGWQSSKPGLHAWGNETPAFDAYIVWSLVSADMESKIGKEIETAAAKALKTKDNYLLALMGNTLSITGDEKANKMLELLMADQLPNGSWSKAKTTVTRSSGKSLILETTALAALALMESGKYPEALKKAMDFLQSQKSRYGYGSTQATVLVMKAKIEYAKLYPQKSKSGILNVYVDNKKIVTKEYTGKETKELVIAGLADYLKEGKQKVRISFDKTDIALPYYLTLNYNTLLPENDKAAALKLSTILSTSKAEMGETVRMTIDVKNTRNQQVASPIVRIGIPAGLTLPIWQLKELSEKESFDYYEIFEGDLVLYFRQFDAKESRTIQLDLKAEMPGTFEASASSAWLYYENEHVVWSKPGDLIVGE